MISILIARARMANASHPAPQAPERESLDAYRGVPDELAAPEPDTFEGLDLDAWDQQARLEIEAIERQAAYTSEMQTERIVLDKLAALTLENGPWLAAKALFGSERS